MSCIYLHCIHCFPLFSLVDFETDATTALIDYSVDNPSFSTELLGKQTPFDHPDIAYSFSLLLALE
jgi:hypothetical protein